MIRDVEIELIVYCRDSTRFIIDTRQIIKTLRKQKAKKNCKYNLYYIQSGSFNTQHSFSRKVLTFFDVFLYANNLQM